MSLRLKALCAEHAILHADLAAAVGISRPALSGLIHRNVLPRSHDREAVAGRITAFLRAHGVPQPAQWQTTTADATTPPPEETPVLAYKSLTPAAMQHFELKDDPFRPVEDIADVFLSPDLRSVREAMYYAAMRNRFVAVIGESGAGKSTLREELIDRLQREKREVHVIEPAVIAMAGTEANGRPLRVQDIFAEIMATVAPSAQPKNSHAARERQLKQTLIESHRAGFRHVIVIEEAHAMPTSTLNHLKRLLEIKDGLRPVLGILLLGQPELALKLSESNPHVREVVQRIEVVTLPPLDNHLDAYLKHRYERAGVPVGRVLERSGIDGLRERMASSKQRGMSLLYPLAVQNVLMRAMNLAAELGAPRVTADVVKAA